MWHKEAFAKITKDKWMHSSQIQIPPKITIKAFCLFTVPFEN
jgi:hypothetical protein